MSERRRILMGQGGGTPVPPSPLPEGYTAYDYIQTTARGPFLLLPATNIALRNFKMELVGQCDDIVNHGIVFGTPFTSPFSGLNALWLSNMGSGVRRLDLNGRTIFSITNASSKFTFTQNGVDVSYDNGAQSLTGSYPNPTEAQLNALQNGYIALFNHANVASVTNKIAGKIWSCKVWNGNTPFYDIQPCTDNNGVPCIYEKVTRQTLYNAGTGSFTVGNDN